MTKFDVNMFSFNAETSIWALGVVKTKEKRNFWEQHMYDIDETWWVGKDRTKNKNA